MKLSVCFLVGTLLISVPPFSAGAVTIQGTLVYEKIPATVNGLDLRHPVEAPVAQVSVTLLTADQKKILATGTTDDDGSYRLDIPGDTGPVTLYVKAKSGNIEVVDPATNNILGGAFKAFEPADWPKKRVIPDAGRNSGPFNILATLRRANRLLAQIDPSFQEADLPLAVFWSPSVAQGSGHVGNAIALNGRRDQDSDEFDDSVILSVYADYLLERFARKEIPWGPWATGERLDPRFAWQLGWRQFFAQAVLGPPVFVNTMGPDGKQVLAFDLEQDQAVGDISGYWSVHTVASTLWDLGARRGVDDQHLGLGLAPLWQVVRERYSQQPFFYLITLADGLVERESSQAAGIAAVLARHGIEYHPGAVPSVPLPFPRLLAPGIPVTGSINTRTTGRINLMSSADYYRLRTEGTKPVRLQLAVTEEPVPGAAFMHLIVLNPRGHLIKDAQSWLKGAGAQAELTLSLPADTYVVGVESFWELSDGIYLTGTGQYRLTVMY